MLETDEQVNPASVGKQPFDNTINADPTPFDAVNATDVIEPKSNNTSYIIGGMIVFAFVTYGFYRCRKH